jgi:HEAT repeats
MQRRRAVIVLFALSGLAMPATAQDISKAVTGADGAVQVLFPAAPLVCGDGESFIRTSRGRGQAQTYVGSSVFTGRDNWTMRPCAPGPTRVLALVMGGEITRLSVFVGPVPRSAADIRSITASAADATAWLGDLVARGQARIASRAIEALMFADAPPPWPLLLRVARDTERARDIRRSALTWLSYGATDKLGLMDVDDRTNDDDEMRAQAVFVLSQQPKYESVPELVALARTAKYPAARKAAIFWLGQSGDPRAIDVFAELLGLR